MSSENPLIEKGLNRALQRIHATRIGSARFGWKHKSAGCHAVWNGADVWVRVQRKLIGDPISQLWTGSFESATIVGVAKPELLNSFEWVEGISTWRAEVTTFITAEVCSETPELLSSISLPQTWFSELRSSLLALNAIRTNRVSTRQDLITRRITERFGPDVDTIVQRWVTCHGDTHWANLTYPTCWILDWEGWGVGPVGLDSAFLLCFSLLQPKIAARVETTFADWLDTPDGIRSSLFACAELLRMNELHGDYPRLVPKLASFGSQQTARARFIQS